MTVTRDGLIFTRPKSACCQNVVERMHREDSTIVDVATGDRVSVWWPAEKEYFDGTVTKISKDENASIIVALHRIR